VARSLRAYAEKRDFSRTAEPPPKPTRSAQGSRRRFVVQKHAASHLHYDFRLEIGDALKSWAVPKGVPTRVGERRSAFETEDHPLEYLDFEGVIPEGEYGGGTVMVWDIGTFEIVDGNYYQGRITVHLRGKKLRGAWLLERTREEDGRRIWLMSRQGKSMKAIGARREDSSALSGRSMVQIAGARDAVWTRDSGEQRAAKASGPKEKPRFLEPMKCKLVERLPTGDEWLWEIKWDGYRCVAVKTSSGVELYSRYGKKEFTKRFASLTRALAAVPGTWTIDGEIVALDDEGRPAFQRLQNNRSTEVPTVFYAFDLLNENGVSLRDAPMSERRARLERLLSGTSDPIRISATLNAAGEEAAEAIKELGLEGIVGKRADSRYEPGERSGAWIKQRFSRDEDFLIGGWIPGASGFDSLLVGQVEGKKLRFVAKVKNGFVPATRELVFEKIAPLETDTCPFYNLPEKKGARRSNPLTKEGMKECRWCQPRVSCRVAFVEWTDAGNLRHATFLGLREEGHR
jgi:bifunctional non-homologous end joining protein LigD